MRTNRRVDSRAETNLEKRLHGWVGLAHVQREGYTDRRGKAVTRKKANLKGRYYCRTCGRDAFLMWVVGAGLLEDVESISVIVPWSCFNFTNVDLHHSLEAG